MAEDTMFNAEDRKHLRDLASAIRRHDREGAVDTLAVMPDRVTQLIGDAVLREFAEDDD
jgi:hypothetical protein